jgi:hypothetical protein
MVNVSGARVAAWAVLVLLGAAWAPARADDFEKALLRKYQQQGQQGSLQVKADVEKNLARAADLSPTEPEKALALLRQTRELLDAANDLPREERNELACKLDDGFRDAKARLESLQQLLKAPPPEPTVGPVIPPTIVGVPFRASATVTPIVSPDRRWVRISMSGSFTFLSGLRPVPVQIPVPTLLQGPFGRLILVR